MMEIINSGCLLVAAVMIIGSSAQEEVKTEKEPGKTGNFMEDEQWLATISQYSRKIKHWNRFRDVSWPRELKIKLRMCVRISISIAVVRRKASRRHWL